MRRLFNILFGSLAMFTVAVISAFVSMRLAIHGREVTVPALTGLTVTQATTSASSLGLNLSLQNRFYSTTVPAGHILTQSPAPGSIVRRDSQLRVAESLGPQHVTIPNVIGQSERAASLMLRRLSLELGTTAHLPTPSAQPNDAEGLILAQSPSPNSAAAASPRVSFLVGTPQPPAAEAEAYVMPSLIGLNYAKAVTLLASAGLHLSAAPAASTPSSTATDPNDAPPVVFLPAPSIVTAAPSLPPPPPTPAAPAPPAPPRTTPPAISWNAIVVAQSPLAGHRVTHTDPIRITAINKSTQTP